MRFHVETITAPQSTLKVPSILGEEVDHHNIIRVSVVMETQIFARGQQLSKALNTRELRKFFVEVFILL